nr:hypothetical protein [Tanacetum cinerariifolium]
MGLSTKGFRRFDGKKKPATRDDKSYLKCEECGMNRHTKDQCFEIIDYLDWWTDGHKTTSNKGAKKDKPSTSPTANTRKSTKNSNDRRSERGFGGVAAAVGEEGEESFSVKGYQDGTDYWAWLTLRLFTPFNLQIIQTMARGAGFVSERVVEVMGSSGDGGGVVRSEEEGGYWYGGKIGEGT